MEEEYLDTFELDDGEIYSINEIIDLCNKQFKELEQLKKESNNKQLIKGIISKYHRRYLNEKI